MDWKCFYRIVQVLDYIAVLRYQPLILNKDNQISKNGVIYAPNHRKTMDAFIMVAAVRAPVHWVALKRFFDGEDSIFNNSKNKILCNITRFLFHG